MKKKKVKQESYRRITRNMYFPFDCILFSLV